MTGADDQATPARAFGQRLRALRRRAGLTQEQLAERAFVSAYTVSNLERGYYAAPRIDTVSLVADALGLEGRVRADVFTALDRLHGRDAAAVEVSARLEPDGDLAMPAALPPARHPMLGRQELLAALLAHLGDPSARVTTLLGPGGVGKTRIALEAARQTANAGRPVVWAALEALGGPEEVLPAIARAVGATGQPGEDPVARIADAVAGRNLLLVLDNCEHVLEAVRDVSAVLAAAPALQVLATSRALLRIDEERVLDVPPLPVPAAGEDAAANPAVALFVARAGHGGSDADLAAVRRVVTALDGMPLAIELAAAQRRAFSVAAIADLLDAAGIDLLDSGRRDAHDRLRSMDAAIRWSTDLLGPRERRLLRVLSVFLGGADLELLGEVCDRLDEPRLLRSLPALVQASLAAEQPGPDGAPRIHLLSPIRLFAEAELEAAGEAEAAERAHRETMIGHARRAFAWMTGAEALAGLGAMDRERDNLVAALDRAIRAGDTHDAMALAGCMGIWWENRGEVTDGFRWLERALAMPGAGAHPEDVSWAGRVAAMLAVFLGRTDRWKAIADMLLATAEETGHAAGVAIARTWLADYAWYVDGDLAAARALHERAVAAAEPLGDCIELAQARDRLGDVLTELGDPAAALPVLDRSLAVRRRLGNLLYLAAPTLVRAGALATLGREAEARAEFLEAAALAERMGPPVVIAQVLVRVAAIDADAGDPDRIAAAARLLGTADAMHERLRVGLDATLVPYRDAALTVMAAALGEPERDRLLAEGRELTVAEALALAG